MKKTMRRKSRSAMRRKMDGRRHIARKAAAAVFALCIPGTACLLTSCSLAAEDGNLPDGGDRLVGIFLTTEYVDAVDWDSVDFSALMKGKTISGSQEKIYGVFDKEQGEYVFEGLEGYSLGIMRLKEEEGEEYLASAASGYLTDVNLNMGDTENTCSGVLYYDRTQIGSEYVIYEDESCKDMDNGQDIAVNNAIQEDGSEVWEICENGKELTLYGNAVYETREETIYMVPGSGVRISDAEGDWSVTLSDTVTEVDNGKKTETKNTFQVTYRGAYPVQSVKFTWHDKDGNVLKEESFSADEIPSSIQWGKNTAYILAAMERTDKTMEYELISEDDESFELHPAADSLILKSVVTEVEK
ncbi:MAG: hypothetical protein PUG60_01480 [Lachnospiraceae bacterium]|nr:hypothetical protein [Lachnospiraceae bacterium]